jgi:hypothetical protein
MGATCARIKPGNTIPLKSLLSNQRGLEKRGKAGKAGGALWLPNYLKFNIFIIAALLRNRLLTYTEFT